MNYYRVYSSDLRDNACLDKLVKDNFEKDSYYLFGNYRNGTVVEMVRRSNTYFILAEIIINEKSIKSIFVAQISIRFKEYENFGVDFSNEVHSPDKYDCPAKLLNLASAPLTLQAFQWRLRCKSFANKKTEKVERAKVRKETLKVGSLVSFYSSYGFRTGRRKKNSVYIPMEYVNTFRYLGGSRFRMEDSRAFNNGTTYRLTKWKNRSYDIIA